MNRALLTATALLGIGTFSAGLLAAPPYRYDHVVIVIEENTSYNEVLGNRVDAPFINELADGGVNFTEFYAVTHPSQPNYLHLFSGDNQGITDDNRPTTYPWSTPNLGAALVAAGATFARLQRGSPGHRRPRYDGRGHDHRPDGVEAAVTPTFTLRANVYDLAAIFDVTADVSAWLGGATNNGWALLPSGIDNWWARSSEYTTATAKRPTLEIAYTLPVAAGYPAWQLAKFTTTAGQPGSLPADDPDADGATNLLEYALSTHPLRAATADLPALAAAPAQTALTFFRNLAATDVTLSVEAKATLAATTWSTIATWTNAAGWTTAAGVAVLDLGGAVTVTEGLGPPATPRRFWRVKAVGP